MSDEAQIERTKELMKLVYSKGFNIYACLNRLKKKLKLNVDFPNEAIIETCNEYLKDPSVVRNEWTWFLRVFKAKSGEHFSGIQQREAEDRRKDGRSKKVPPAMKDIMKGMFG